MFRHPVRNFEQGDFGDTIYFIRSEVESIKDAQIVGQLGPGDVFGEIALISNQPRAAAIRAKTALDVVSVNRSAFQQLLAHVPGVEMTMQGIMEKHLAGASLREFMAEDGKPTGLIGT